MLLRPHKYRRCWGGSHLHLLDSLMLPSKHLHSLNPQVIHPFSSLCPGPKHLLWGYDTGWALRWEEEFFHSVRICPHMSPTSKYKPTETSLPAESHFSYCPTICLLPFPSKNGLCLLPSILTSIPTPGFCTECSAKTIIIIGLIGKDPLIAQSREHFSVLLVFYFAAESGHKRD